jgi:hypothetical protein
MTSNGCSGFLSMSRRKSRGNTRVVSLILAVLLKMIPAGLMSETVIKVCGFTGSVFDEVPCLRFQPADD